MAAPFTATVAVDGGAAVRRVLEHLADDVDHEIDTLNAKLSRDIVQGAQRRARTPQQRRVAAALAPAAGGKGGGVELRGANVAPFALGAEFGSDQFRQFQAFTGSGPSAGYFLTPAYRAADVAGAYDDALADVIRKAD